MLNIEKYRDEILNNCKRNMQFQEATAMVARKQGILFDDTIKNAMDWLCEEYVEPLLTEKEKNWLKTVCEPFYDKVKYVVKDQMYVNGSEFIAIEMCDDEGLYFPDFAEGTQFRNLETDKKYSLKELGISYDASGM